jgi:hypothetical protein
LVGALQRRKLLEFLNRLKPSCLHTTNLAYQIALARRGWPAEILPLFGNIPVAAIKPEIAQATLVQLAGAALPPAPRYVGVIFGTIHPQWKPDATMNWLQSAAHSSGRPICLLAVGRAGAHGTKLLKQLVRDSAAIRVIEVGPQPPEMVSHLLQAVDFGVATHPWALLGKSGTTVALLEHGLPVLAPRDDWELRDGAISSEHDPLLRKMAEIQPTEFVGWIGTRRAPSAQLPALAARFIAQLSGPATQGALVA